ncbi:hypothetical protein KAR91_06830 [Candidatus Pacearchaeota archaeon]|nr:hypothetical protein [Candidatus Pacearchaeota archaeon]
MIEITIDVKSIGVFRRGERAQIERTRQKRKDRIKNRHESQTRLIK